MRSYEMLAGNRAGTSVTYTTFADLGDPQTNVSAPVINGTDVVLNITNNSVESLIVYVVRVGVPIDSTVTAPTTDVVELEDYHFTATLGSSTVLDVKVPYNARGSLWLLTVSAPDGRRESSQLISLNGIAPLNQPGTSSQYALLGHVGMLYTADIRTINQYGTMVYELEITNNDTVDYKVDAVCIPNKLFEEAVTACATVVPTPSLPTGVQMFAPPAASVPGGTTVTVDTGIVLPGITALHYLWWVYDPIATSFFGAEINLAYDPISGVTFTTYASVGDVVYATLTPIVREGKINFDFTNNGTNLLNTSFVRIPTKYSY